MCSAYRFTFINSFSYERFSTEIRLETEVQGNSEVGDTWNRLAVAKYRGVGTRQELAYEQSAFVSWIPAVVLESRIKVFAR